MTDSFNLGERSRPLLSRQVIRDAIITQRTGISLNSKNTQSDRILLQWSIEKKGNSSFYTSAILSAYFITENWKHFVFNAF